MAPYSGLVRIGRGSAVMRRIGAWPCRPTGDRNTRQTYREGRGPMRTLHQIAARLEATEPSRTLIERCLDRIKDPAGEGPRPFLKGYGEAERAAPGGPEALRGA